VTTVHGSATEKKGKGFEKKQASPGTIGELGGVQGSLKKGLEGEGGGGRRKPVSKRSARRGDRG